MSDFDDNLAEVRALREANRSKSANTHTTDLERQPLLTTSVPISTNTPEVSEISHNDLDYQPQDNTTESQSSPIMASLFFTLSAAYGATAVALGAFGAHGLKKRIADPSRIGNWSTAAQYQLVHSVALLATTVALPARAQRIPGTLFLLGMTMFSGSIYLLVLDPQRFKALGPVTPLGGLCLIGGWVALGVVGRRFVR